MPVSEPCSSQHESKTNLPHPSLFCITVATRGLGKKGKFINITGSGNGAELWIEPANAPCCRKL